MVLFRMGGVLLNATTYMSTNYMDALQVFTGMLILDIFTLTHTY